MDLNEIIMDSIIYPSNNIKALGIYILMGIILAIVAVSTGLSVILVAAENVTTSIAGIIVFLIGLIISIVIYCLIEGYGLDIIKLGINRSNNAPEIDLERQVSNGFKMFVVGVVYLFIPAIITFVLSLFLQSWLVTIIGFILFILFMFILSMAQCRLAESDDLTYALNVGGAFADLTTIGVPKVVMTILAIIIVSGIITFIVNAIVGLAGSEMLTSIISAIVAVYMTFFSNRAMGLLYSDK